ncbi:hypothetical protein TNIN_126171 [Trichonephila inaurata madagascariensis]|uniref:Uncharacterized protein n=1 Tax=Trichonephila inaurata madagascariensis TaxID=2747483 RepID=A0A8X6WPB8_9ARAC|nr:hypothetical protein TNIN_126171 [Trichonephila inaurata madagascariensis]
MGPAFSKSGTSSSSKTSLGSLPTKTSLPFGGMDILLGSLGPYFLWPFSLVISQPVLSSNLAMASSLLLGGLPVFTCCVISFFFYFPVRQFCSDHTRQDHSGNWVSIGTRSVEEAFQLGPCTSGLKADNKSVSVEIKNGEYCYFSSVSLCRISASIVKDDSSRFISVRSAAINFFLLSFAHGDVCDDALPSC